MSDYWKFIVRRAGTPTVLLQTDCETEAFRFAMESHYPARVIKVATGECLYFNLDGPHNVL